MHDLLPIPEYPSYLISKEGAIKKSHPTRGLKSKKATIAGSGYFIFGVFKNGLRKNLLLHRVLAEVFIPNPLNKPCVNHKNGIKTDNRLENLEWVTHSENTQHGRETGLIPKRCNTNLTQSDVDFIRSRKVNVQQLADKFDISVRQVYKIISKQAW